MAEKMYPTNPNPTTYEEKSTRSMLDGPLPPLAETFNAQLPGGRRRCSVRCCCWLSFIFSIIFILVIISVITLVVLQVVYRNPLPSYFSVDKVSVKGLSLKVGGGGAFNEILHSELDITISANNTSPKIGITYESGSSVEVYTSNLLLTNGTMPKFYQPTQTMTVFIVNTTGDVPYTGALSTALNGQNTRGMIPLVVRINAPVMLKLAPDSYTLKMIAVNCDVLINSLENTGIVSKKCSEASMWEW